jgi:alkanesulfonate monooxygenase SsuD/methylene tetrahydromethanopterin reductase-like flavin-dependent oxidoreductase (luciferase family)
VGLLVFSILSLAYGYEFPKGSVRIAQLDETVQIIRKLWTQSPASFEGRYYHLKDAYCSPKPEPLPPIMVGGGGEKLTLGVVAKQADWWNFHHSSPEAYAHKLDVLRAHCERVGRDYNDIVKTYGVEALSIAETEAEAQRIAEANPYYDKYPIIGTPNQVVEQLRPYIELGVEHIIIRFVDFPDTAGIELFSQAVIPQLLS